MSYAIIVAADKNNGIGKDGGLPWHLPEDLKHFKRLTTETDDPGRINAVVMGRKTWESLPERFRPLPGRLNIVLTRNPDYPLPADVLRCASLEDLASLAGGLEGINKIFIIGGEQIFRAALKAGICREVYLTRIDHIYECDTFFPELGPGYVPDAEMGSGKSQGIGYCFQCFRQREE